MKTNNHCYRVTVGADGELNAAAIEFSARFADTCDNALYRLRERAHLQPPVVRVADWLELAAAWEAERAEYRALMICQFACCESPLCDITAANGVSQREAELLIAAGWDGAEDFWYCPAHKHLLQAVPL